VGGSEPAEKLGDRYAIYGEIASGGMASVHFARLVGGAGFSRTVAVKRLHANLREQPEFVRMFLDEARLATRVRHPNVVATIDVIETDTQICLIMEYVHGEALRRLARAAMSQGGRVPRRIAAAIMVGALNGLHAAHEAKNERGEPLNLVHRDVSPHNILVGTDGISRVIDFGIAKARGQLRDTDAGTIKGKFAYMAPEQLVGGTVTRAADIYAASVVLWELFTGRRLFGSTVDASLLQRASARIDPPSMLVPSLSPALDGIVLRGLSPDPADRFETARAMARAIEDCIAPASAADVGEWVERMARDRLEERERQLEAIDATEGQGGASLSAPLPSIPGIAPGSFRDEEAPPSESEIVPAHARESEIDTLERNPSADVEVDAEPKTAVDRASLGPVRPSRANRYWLAALGVILCLTTSLALAAPGCATREVASAAAERGLSFTAGEALVRPSRVVLTGSRFEPVALADVTLTVGDVDILLRQLRPNGIVVQSYDLSLRGPALDVASHFASWTAAQHARLEGEARSGHWLWKDPFGDGTSLEAWDVAISSSEGRLTVVSPSVLVRTPHGKLGPWSLRYDRARGESRLEVTFDPSLPSAGFTWVKTEDSSGTVKTSAVLDLPRTTLSRIGIPSEAVGLLGDVEVQGRVTFAHPPSPGIAGAPEGQVVLSFFGLRGVLSRTAPTDALFVARLASAPDGSCHLQEGQASVGTFRTPVGGTLSMGDLGASLELAFSWPPGIKGLPASIRLDTTDLAAWGGDGTSGAPPRRGQ
jgi:serine/threonine protein kinase